MWAVPWVRKGGGNRRERTGRTLTRLVPPVFPPRPPAWTLLPECALLFIGPPRRPSSLRSFTLKASPSTAGKEKSARGSERLADRGLRGERLQGRSSTRSPSLWMLQISFPLGIWVHLTAPPFITKYLEVLSALTVCSPSFHSFLNPPVGFCTVAIPPTQLLSRSPMPLTLWTPVIGS